MSRLQASLLGGLFIGVLSSLPVVSVLNCCCLWVVAGGVLTVYLQQQGQPTSIQPIDAAISGLLAGVIGATITLLFSMLLVSAVGGETVQSGIRQFVEQYPDQVPEETRELLNNLSESPALFLLLAVVTIPLYAIVGMLGALLGTIFFRKPTPPTPAQV